MDPVEQIVDALVRALDPRKIILFGSRARGEHGPESDFDIVVVTETDLPPARRAFLAHMAVRDLGLPTDIVVYTPEEFERLSAWLSSIASLALREGKVVHEAA